MTTTTALLEFADSVTYPVGQFGALNGAILEGQEGSPATVLLNGSPISYPAVLSVDDVLTLTRSDPSDTGLTRLYGQPSTLVYGTIWEANLDGTYADNGEMVAVEVPGTGKYATDMRFRSNSDVTLDEITLRSHVSKITTVPALFTVNGDGVRTEYATGDEVRLGETEQVTLKFPESTFPAGTTFSLGFYAPQGTVIGYAMYYAIPATTDDGAVTFLSTMQPIDGAPEWREYFVNTTFKRRAWYTTQFDRLDPAKFPVSDVDSAPASSGFMMVDDAAKSASLYWKFSDGTTKKLDLT